MRPPPAVCARTGLRGTWRGSRSSGPRIPPTRHSARSPPTRATAPDSGAPRPARDRRARRGCAPSRRSRSARCAARGRCSRGARGVARRPRPSRPEAGSAPRPSHDSPRPPRCTRARACVPGRWAACPLSERVPARGVAQPGGTTTSANVVRDRGIRRSRRSRAAAAATRPAPTPRRGAGARDRGAGRHQDRPQADARGLEGSLRSRCGPRGGAAGRTRSG